MYRTLYQGNFAIDPPPHLRRAMLARGGCNSYGEPMYRLVRAEARKRLAWGRWHEWPRGLKTRFKNPELNRAVRSFIGVKPVPMYPGENGWVLERYATAEVWGSNVQWYSPESLGGTKRWMGADTGYILAAGHYPYRGDYQGTDYIFPNDVSESLIANAIGRIEQFRDGMPKDPFRRARQETTIAEIEEARSEAAWTAYFNDQADPELDSLNARTPEARGEVGEYIKDSLGIREHPWN